MQLPQFKFLLFNQKSLVRWCQYSLILAFICCILPTSAKAAWPDEPCQRRISEKELVLILGVIESIIGSDEERNVETKVRSLERLLPCALEPVSSIKLAEIFYFSAIAAWDEDAPEQADYYLRQIFVAFPVFEWDFSLIKPEASQSNELLYGAFKKARSGLNRETGWIDLSDLPDVNALYIDGTLVESDRREAQQMSLGHHFIQVRLASGLVGGWFEIVQGEIVTIPFPQGGTGRSYYAMGAANSLWISDDTLGASAFSLGVEGGIMLRSDHLELGFTGAINPIQRPTEEAEALDELISDPVVSAVVRLGWGLHAKGGDLGLAGGLLGGGVYVPDAKGYGDYSGAGSVAWAVPTSGGQLGLWLMLTTDIFGKGLMFVGVDANLLRVSGITSAGDNLLENRAISSPSVAFRLGISKRIWDD